MNAAIRHIIVGALTLLAIPLGTAPALGSQADGPDLNAVRGRNKQFIGPWTEGDASRAASFFRDPEVFQAARARTPYAADDLTLLSRHITITAAEDGAAQAIFRTYWARRMKGAEGSDARVEPFVSDEIFTYGADLKIVAYHLEDRTAETRARFAAAAKEKAAQVRDPQLPLGARLEIGASLYLNYWQIANADELWPLLHEMIEMGLLEPRSPKALNAVKGLAARAAGQLPVPEAYRADVDRVVNWVAPGGRAPATRGADQAGTSERGGSYDREN